MKLSVIIPCYNAAETIATQLDALGKQAWSEPWEIIVSDNGSTDATRSVVDRYRERLPHLRVVDASARRGRSYARNIAVLAAEGDAVAFCDADDEVGPGWVEALGTALAKYDFVASRKDYEKFNTSWVQRARGLTDDHQIFQTPFPPFLKFSATCGLGVRRALHLAVGGFDEALPRSQDADYCFKVQRAGAELRLVPEAIVSYRYRENLGGLLNQKFQWAFYDALLYKRYRAPEAAVPNPWRLHLYHWRSVLGDVSRIKGREDFAQWMVRLATQAGILLGSIRFRVTPVPRPGDLDRGVRA